MELPASLRVLTRNELIQHLSIQMASANRNPPILRRKAAPRDASERDRLRHDFAAWIVDIAFGQGLKVVASAAPPATRTHFDFPGSTPWDLGTPPQLLQNVRAWREVKPTWVWGN